MQVVTAHPNEYAVFASHGTGLSKADIDVVGGGGVLRTLAAKGTTSIVRCRQASASKAYVFYIGPQSMNVDTKQADGTVVSSYYEEDYTDTVVIDHCDAMFGSQYDACGRFVGFKSVHINVCNWSDTDAQSAPVPHAIRNTVCRAHHGGVFRMTGPGKLWGDIFLGPMNGGDGGINATGERRKFFDTAHLDEVFIENIDFDLGPHGVFVLAPGIKKLTIQNCRITTSQQAIFSTPFPYMSRTAVVGIIQNCPIVTKNKSGKPPTMFSESDGGALIKVVNCPIKQG